MRPSILDVTITQSAVHRSHGSLAVFEIAKGLNYEVQRVFFVYDVAKGTVRGQHAHIKCKQTLVAISGSILIECDDAISKKEYLLSSPDQALYIPETIWASQSYLTDGAVLAVFADQTYDPEDYIRNYQEFLEFRR
jgi:UDP-2-acetamido-3-amino-2,3-dideoxy-glucuronate N-acetyltransferase